MNKRLAIRLACSALAASTAIPIEIAYAQTQQGQVEEVVVTARRRAEDIQKVPTAVTAFGSEQLEERNIVSQSDLQSAVPGLTLRQTQGSNSLTYSIRGQTVDNFTGSATAVVPYFDDVQLVTGGASSFYDLQSIQVLKGPQGTLFGRNATGGAVLYTSAKPDDKFGGYLKVRGGNYGMVEGQVAVNIPLVEDKVLLRIAGDSVHRDGYQHNFYYGDDRGVVDRQGVRISLTVRPNDRLENTTVVEFDHAGGNSTSTRLNHVIPGSNPDFLFSPAVDYAFGPGFWASYLAANPKVDPLGISHYLANQGSHLGFWNANDITPVVHRENDEMLVNTTTYNVNPDLELKNIFGASQTGFRDLGSSVGAPYLVFYSANLNTGEYGNRTRQLTLSDEAQIQGKAMDDALTYIFGAYVQNSDNKTTYPQVYYDLSPPGAPYGLPTSLDNAFEIRDSNEAVYAQGSYDFTKMGLTGVSFTAGYRYTWEQFSLNQLPISGYYNYPFGNGNKQKVSFSNPSWTLGVSWQATDDLMLYVQGRRSWRSGGLNGTAPPLYPTVGAEAGGNLFKPEYTRDVEIGAKYAGEFLGRPSHFDFAAYNQWIDNVQRAEFPTPTVGPNAGNSIAVTINVPEAEVTGLEFDGGIQATDWLELGLSGAVTDAHFVSGQNTANIFGTLYVFNPYADTPRYSGSIYGVVYLPVPEEMGTMSLRTDIYAQSAMYFSNNASTITPDTRNPGYGLVNMRYDWKDIYGSGMSVAAFATNLFNQPYYTGGFALDASLGVSSRAIGQPRMYGVEVSYDF